VEQKATETVASRAIKGGLKIQFLLLFSYFRPHFHYSPFVGQKEMKDICRNKVRMKSFSI
jgi:hypothetical protein